MRRNRCRVADLRGTLWLVCVSPVADDVWYACWSNAG